MSQQKHIGRDCELSTTGVDAYGDSVSPWAVTTAVLRQVEPALHSQRVSVWSKDSFSSAYSHDCLRHWTSAGHCYYGDLAHVEACTPTCLVPRDFAAHSIATLMVAEASRVRAQQEATPGVRYDLSAANVDLCDPSISFGSHVSVSVTTQLWENLFIEQRNPAVLGYVASVMAAAATFFGAGYLRPHAAHQVNYCLNARTHHITKLHTLTTTEKWRRGLLNSRREPHGTAQQRLHLICFDFAVIASALMASMLQSALAAAEEGYCGLNLFDPVGAMHAWSTGIDVTTGKLPATAQLIDGRQLTLPEYIRELAGVLLDMCEGRLIVDEVAPDAQRMLPRIVELTHYAEEGSLQRCAVHLDWAAKLVCLSHRDGNFADASMRLADHDFSNTNPAKGMFWKLWESGLVDPLVDMCDAQACVRNAPTESRDWGRGQLIDRFTDDIADVDWSFVDLCCENRPFSPRFRVDFPHLDSLNQSQFQQIVNTAQTAMDLRLLLENWHETRCAESEPLGYQQM